MKNNSSLYGNLSTAFNIYWENTKQGLEDYLIDAVEHLLLACAAYIALCGFLYYGSFYWKNIGVIKPHPKKVLFVTAHPDDECMFFGPTIIRLSGNTNCSVYLLCLSKGNYDGKGNIRKSELWEACRILGIPDSNITLHNNTMLSDNPKEKWREDIVANIVLAHLESLEIDTLITFDKHGISRHSNHSSIFFALAYLLMDKKIPPYCKVYTLESINIIRKYWLLLDIPLSYIFSVYRYIIYCQEKERVSIAMKKHASQFVWYRRLYILFSRYTMINTLSEMNTINLELDLELDVD